MVSYYLTEEASAERMRRLVERLAADGSDLSSLPASLREEVERRRGSAAFAPQTARANSEGAGHGQGDQDP